MIQGGGGGGETLLPEIDDFGKPLSTRRAGSVLHDSACLIQLRVQGRGMPFCF